MSLSAPKQSEVSRAVQKTLLIRNVWHWTFALLAAAAAVMIAHIFKSAPFDQGVSMIERCGEALRDNFLLLTTLVCLVPIFLRDSFRVTKRLVEPLASIQAAVDELGRGKIPETVGSQKAKCWESLAESVNRAAERMRALNVETPPSGSWETAPSERLEEPLGV